MCEVIGSCTLCGASIFDTEPCRDTGRRVKIRCKDGENEIEDYKSCSLTAEDDQLRVILFQIIMAFIGGLAYYGVQSRKRFSMTLFDHRKLRGRQQV